MVGRSPTGGFHFLCPSLSSLGRTRSTSPRSISARSSMLALWYEGGGGRRMATAVGSGAGPLSFGALRASRFDEGGAATSVLARTASGDVQPSAALAAWVAAAIRSGAGTILTDASAAAAGGFSAGAGGLDCAAAGGGLDCAAAGGGLDCAVAGAGVDFAAAPGGADSGWNSLVSITRPCT